MERRLVPMLVLIGALVGALLPYATPTRSFAANGPATLVKTIATNPTTISGGGYGFVTASSTVYFSAYDPATGYELWKTDGTSEGTSLVVDLAPGPDSSSPNWMIELNGLLLFSASTLEHGTELYLTDGSPAGTTLLKDIRPGPGSSYPSNFAKAGSFVYFTANDGTRGTELWRTDGTPNGTQLVADVTPGYRSSDIREIVAVGNAIYFTTTDASGPYQLYYSTGTGATKVSNVGTATYLTALNDTTLIFSGYPAAGTGSTELWRAVAGVAERVKDIYPGDTPTQSSYPRDFAKVGPYLVFQANDSVHGYELWRTDGTEAGTVLVKDIVPGGISDSSYPTDLTSVGDYVYFRASTSTTGFELWRTDGTEGGTVMVKDIAPGANNSNPSYFKKVGSQVFFIAWTPGEGHELWKTNGTPAGTTLVRDINPGAAGSDISYSFEALGNVAIFSATDGTNGIELWRSDGTAAGTYMIRNVDDQLLGSAISQLVTVGNIAYFTAQDAAGNELWRTDGTPDGTYRVKDIAGGANSSYPSGLTPFGTKLLFHAYDPEKGGEPFISDGTAGGTTYLRDILPGPGSSQAWNFTVLDSIALFSASDDPSGNFELWKTDGTNAGTVKVKEINPSAGSNPTHFAALHSDALGWVALFSANNGTDGWELWRSDGTALGTELVRNINTKMFNGVEGDSFPTNLTTAGKNVFFSADDGDNGRQLWVSDGTTAGTRMVKLINPTGSALSELTIGTTFPVIGSTVYFVADDGVHGVELWKSDGTEAGTVMVKDILPSGSSDPTHLTAVGNFLYFVADDGVHGRELWRTDGTEAGTVMVADLTPGSGSTSIYEIALARADGRVIFTANAAGVGYELWQTNGTQAGTRLVQDINPGAGSSIPLQFHRFGSQILFTADDGTYGRQLWSIAASALNLPPTTADGSITSNGGPVSGTLSATDPDGDALTFRIVTPPSAGTATITNASTGAFTYTPNAGASGTDSFTFTVNDGTFDGNISTISITIDPTAEAPAPSYRLFVPIVGVFDDTTGP